MRELDEVESLEAALSLLEDFEPLEEGGLELDHNFGSPLVPLALGMAPATAASALSNSDVFVFGAATSAVAAAAAENAPLQLPPPSISRRSAFSGALSQKKKRRPRTVDFNPNRARDERKEELVYLRAKVVEMEQQLSQLKTTDDQRGATRLEHGLAHAIPHSKASSSLLLARNYFQSSPSSSMWEEIATRQFSERRKSEMENIRLKLLLEGQIKVAKGLERMLNKRSNTQIFELYGNGRVPQRPRSQMSGDEEKVDDTTIFQSLLSDLELAVVHVDAIFEKNGLSKTERAFQGAHVRNDGTKGMYLEFSASKIMPFDIYATGEGVWQHLNEYIDQMPYRSYYRRTHKIQEGNDTLLESFEVELHAKRTTACFNVHQVARRYIQDDRIVIAWRLTMDPIEYASTPTSGIRFLEQSYVIIKRPTTASQEYALMQTCFHVTPERYEPTPDHEHKVGQISNFFLDSNARYIFLSHQMIENCLLEQAARQKAGANA